MTRKIVRSFNVLLEAGESQQLDQLAARTGASRGTVTRWALARAYRMLVQGIPTCASGQACYVPHMHPASQLRPPDDTTPLPGTIIPEFSTPAPIPNNNI